MGFKCEKKRGREGLEGGGLKNQEEERRESFLQLEETERKREKTWGRKKGVLLSEIP